MCVSLVFWSLLRYVKLSGSSLPLPAFFLSEPSVVPSGRDLSTWLSCTLFEGSSSTWSVQYEDLYQSGRLLQGPGHEYGKDTWIVLQHNAAMSCYTRLTHILHPLTWSCSLLIPSLYHFRVQAVKTVVTRLQREVRKSEFHWTQSARGKIGSEVTTHVEWECVCMYLYKTSWSTRYYSCLLHMVTTSSSLLQLLTMYCVCCASNVVKLNMECIPSLHVVVSRKGRLTDWLTDRLTLFQWTAASSRHYQ